MDYGIITSAVIISIHSLTDRMSDSDSDGVGSIPAGCICLEFLFF